MRRATEIGRDGEAVAFDLLSPDPVESPNNICQLQFCDADAQLLILYPFGIREAHVEAGWHVLEHQLQCG